MTNKKTVKKFKSLKEADKRKRCVWGYLNAKCNKISEPFVRCKVHRKQHSESVKLKMEQKHAKGLCTYGACAKRGTPKGGRFCDEHRKWQAAYLRRWRAAKLEKQASAAGRKR